VLATSDVDFIVADVEHEVYDFPRFAGSSSKSKTSAGATGLRLARRRRCW
jgi:hypothetical protein